MEQIGKHIEIKPGFTQCKYVIGNIEVLLSTILKGTSLDNHHHPQEQFGYCINGSFSFCYEKNEKELYKDSYYILKGDIPHSALANEDFYALDFKYIKPALLSSATISEDFVSVHNCIFSILNVSEHFVIKLKSSGIDNSFYFTDPDFDYILFSEKNDTITVSGEAENIETMNLYRVPVGTKIGLNEKSSVYVVVIKKDVIS